MPQRRQTGHIEREVGPGDVCAVLAEPAPGRRTVVTTDALSLRWALRIQARRHRTGGEKPVSSFFWNPPAVAADVGRKAATQSLADVAAMGARPASLFISLLPVALLTAGLFAHGIVDGINACGATNV